VKIGRNGKKNREERQKPIKNEFKTGKKTTKET